MTRQSKWKLAALVAGAAALAGLAAGLTAWGKRKQKPQETASPEALPTEADENEEEASNDE